MYIARLKTISREDKSVIVKTFSFDSEEDLNTALRHLKRCGCPLFAAEAISKDSSSGRLIGTWNMEKEPIYWPGYTTEYGRYKDHCWVNFGKQEECKKWADETNEKAVCYFSTSATTSRVVGDLWRIDYCTPYND